MSFVNFDAKDYILINKLNIIEEEAYQHYLDQPKKTKANLNKNDLNLLIEYDWLDYINKNPDLKHLNTIKDGWLHYLLEGINQNRSITKIDVTKKFDHVYYKNKHCDLKNNNYNTKEKLVKHWLIYGMDQNRLINKYQKESQRNKQEKLDDFYKQDLIIKVLDNYQICNESNYNFNLNGFNKLNNLLKKQHNFTKPAVFIFPFIEYNFRKQRSQHMADCLSKNYTVFYFRKTFGKKLTTNKVKENLYLVELSCNSNRLVYSAFSTLKRNEINLILSSIEDLKKKFKIDKYISIVVNSFWYQILKLTNYPIIYDCIDYNPGLNISSNLLNYEKDMIKNEYTIFTSPILKKFSNFHSDNFTIIRNACQFEYFNKIELNNKEKVVIGYFGCVSDWFDVNLMNYIVNLFPEFEFQIIGNIGCFNKFHEQKIKQLGKYHNVKLLGEIEYSKLHEHLSKFTVGIIPFIVNDLIKCTNPVKLYEMLAMGIPIITTDIDDLHTIDRKDLFYISKNARDFCNNINLCLNEDSQIKKNRIEYAKNNTWYHRTEELVKVIDKICQPISIVLLCHNHWDYTEKCIESVLSNTYYDFELIIVDNNSDEYIKNNLDKYAFNDKIRIIKNNKNYGFAYGMNIGALNASYDYIVLLNNDTIVSKNWLYPLFKQIYLNDYNCGSPITNNCGNEVKQFIYENTIEDVFKFSKMIQENNDYKTLDTIRIPFFCPIIKKDVFYSVGLLDKNYKIGGWEDDDILMKMYRFNNKKNFYTFSSFVYHYGSVTMNDYGGFIKNPNKNYFEKKWMTKWIVPKLKMPIIRIFCDNSNNFLLNIFNNTYNLGEKIFDLTNINYNISLGSGLEIQIENETSDSINLIYKENKYLLNKYGNVYLNLYSIINTCVNHKTNSNLFI